MSNIRIMDSELGKFAAVFSDPRRSALLKQLEYKIELFTFGEPRRDHAANSAAFEEKTMGLFGLLGAWERQQQDKKSIGPPPPRPGPLGRTGQASSLPRRTQLHDRWRYSPLTDPYHRRPEPAAHSAQADLERDEADDLSIALRLLGKQGKLSRLILHKELMSERLYGGPEGNTQLPVGGGGLARCAWFIANFSRRRRA